MKLWSLLASAASGWTMIVRGETGWRERFAITVPGLVTALAIFAFAAFLAVAFASASIGMPSLGGVVAAMFVLALPVTALVVTLIATRMMLTSTDPMLDVLVPGTYLLTAFLLAEGLLAMIGGPVVMLSWLILGYFLYRLARMATSWTTISAIVFAVSVVALLVAMRLALYMLSSLPAAPT
jgi:hypothetical protein